MINGATAVVPLAIPNDAEHSAWLVHRFARVEKMTPLNQRRTIPARVPISARRFLTAYPSFVHSQKARQKARSQGFYCLSPAAANRLKFTVLNGWPGVTRCLSIGW